MSSFILPFTVRHPSWKLQLTRRWSRSNATCFNSICPNQIMFLNIRPSGQHFDFYGLIESWKPIGRPHYYNFSIPEAAWHISDFNSKARDSILRAQLRKWAYMANWVGMQDVTQLIPSSLLVLSWLPHFFAGFIRWHHFLPVSFALPPCLKFLVRKLR